MKTIEDQRVTPLLERAKHQNSPLVFEIALADGRSDGDRDYRFKGTLNFTDNTIGLDTGNITLRGEIPNADYRIFPGQACYVRIPLIVRKDVVVVREEAVLTDLTKKYVLIVGENNIVEKRYVTPGEMADTQHRIIESGLKPGESYIVRGTQKAKVGKEVKSLSFEEVTQSEDR
ncbi:MAG TPA: hypothetical protein DEB39_11555 [Planctomycetaceae bacterium]|nr:hypothetical protein [Planctomycetaceae bacterium]